MVKISVEVLPPDTPSQLVAGNEVVQVGSLTDEVLAQVAKEWTKQLIAKARAQRALWKAQNEAIELGVE